MPNPNLVTIIIPVYNGGYFLSQAIESALAQTWPHVEVLVVDDGSTDDGETARTCRSFGDRIRYIWKENGGVASALNRGIAGARGRYISWLSHDDLYDPRKVEIQMGALLAEPDTVIVFGDYAVIRGDGSLLTEVRVGEGYSDRASLWSTLEGRINGCAVIVPRECFARHGTFDEGLPTTQDYELWFRFAQHHRFVHVPGYLVRHRVHEGQGSRTSRHLEEASLLWMSMLESLAPETMRDQGGSTLAFLDRAANFVQTTGYEGAKAGVPRLVARFAADVTVGVAVLASNSRDALVTLAEVRASGLDIRAVVVGVLEPQFDRFAAFAPDFGRKAGFPVIELAGDLRSMVEEILSSIDADPIAFVSSGAREGDLLRAAARLARRPNLDVTAIHSPGGAPTAFRALDGLMIRRGALSRAVARCESGRGAFAHALGMVSAFDPDPGAAAWVGSSR
ncbi:glycosyltransferase [Methylobacterium nodulans]|uniref:Glycosyl transferase family 2 n=1 Tax=Methylobacterium nodulans (strain LMG 21967 / CNCM I-2342 / ORS 2060) TaxID=460265 RepID=B8IAC9_METNO|nr:glycosyltransferase [Methylobacterium nodulans]ACL59192.1 glycosyl transferase family 2 [Methylobacterium nodulans ORS 2060]